MKYIRFYSCIIMVIAFLFAACTDEVALPEKEKWTPTTELNIGSESEYITAAGVRFKMIRIAKGVFKMGTEDGNADESPIHTVTISKDYFIGETEVTQELWQAVMGSNPSDHQGGNLPVEQVSWIDCQDFIAKLNQLTGLYFRLPTEAEWEFAARGGNMSRGCMYSGSNEIDEVAWHYMGVNGAKSNQVKTKSPNELGIYDMSGNVWEWCSDWYGGNYYTESAVTDPMGPALSVSEQVYASHVVRGGSWYNNELDCFRVYHRGHYIPKMKSNEVGLRLVLPI